MLRPESVAKSEEWMRAASASYWTDNMQEWITEQSPKVGHVCRHKNLDLVCTPTEFGQSLSANSGAGHPSERPAWHADHALSGAKHRVMQGP